ncbi:hypothetical protein Dsin_018828 [Dipteronia sinensis]|uniref:Uncharacterized protein n=1 Tax=Dipteronia sinensis TaxID=43782 RepID=A0AAE0A615_9ROSI|nr:hypothetical protein Dsin_018828 [Dipteronia sinensis]
MDMPRGASQRVAAIGAKSGQNGVGRIIVPVEVLVISSLQAHRYLRKGCVGYLASVVDTKKSGAKLQDVLVANEFPDVFPNDLHGIPPD